jgi:LPS export ABC transporter protein LptC
MKRCFFVILATVFAVACSSKKSGMHFDSINMPTQTVYEAKTMFTDRGELQMLLEQPVLYNYEDDDRTQISPNGIELSFYDKETHEKQVYMRADSAVNSQSSKLMRFYKNVVVYDYRKHDTLYTEALYWDQNKRKIYSDVYTRHLTPTMIYEGTGFDADEQMDNVKVRNPTVSF